MAKVFRVCVVILLLLSITSLVLGIQLFSKREQLKGRTLRLQDSVLETVRILTAEQAPHIEGMAVTVNKDRLSDYETMPAELNKLSAVAQSRYEELSNTYGDLQRTRDELEDTRNELERVRGELTAARQEIARLESEIAQVRADLARAEDEMEQLEDEKVALEVEIEDLSAQLAETEELRRDLEDEVASLKLALSEYVAQEGEPSIPEGLTGEILLVSKDWNFVVLDIGKEAGLVPNAEMLIHREEQLIGKVKITLVEENAAVADILPAWKQDQVMEGDHVLF